jgi:hypothetical protein
MSALRPDLFGQEAELPAGFEHRRELITPGDESILVARFGDLPFAEFEFAYC